jgi:hypothetical protein
VSGTSINFFNAALILYSDILSTIFLEKSFLFFPENDADLPEEYDLYSDTSSVMTSTLNASYRGSQASG